MTSKLSTHLALAGGVLSLVLGHFTELLPTSIGTALFFASLIITALQDSVRKAEAGSVPLTWAAVLTAVIGAFLGPDALAKLPPNTAKVLEFVLQLLTLFGAAAGGRLLGNGPTGKGL